METAIMEALAELAMDLVHQMTAWDLSGLTGAHVAMVGDLCIPVAGVKMAMMHTVVEAPLEAGTPAPGLAAPQERGPQERSQQEEPRFVQLLLPDYFEGSFLVRISAVQCLCFATTLAIGHVGLFPTTCSLYAMGAAWGPSIAAGEVWRLVAPTFLHASLPHLVVNLLFQLRLGLTLEKLLGSGRFGLLYLLTGVCASTISAAFDPLKLAVGCSSSACGILGGNVAAMFLRWGESSSRPQMMLMYLVLVAVGSMDRSSNVDLFGHLGGFISGLCLTPMLYPQKPSPGCLSWTSLASLRKLALAALGSVMALAGFQFLAVPHLLVNCT